MNPVKENNDFYEKLSSTSIKINGYIFTLVKVDDKKKIDNESYHKNLADGIEEIQDSNKDYRNQYVKSVEDLFKKKCKVINKKYDPSDIAEQFCKFELDSDILKEWKEKGQAGVYVWLDKEKIIYIGETTDLYDRFQNGYGHISPRNVFKDGQSTNCKMNYVAKEHMKHLEFYVKECNKGEDNKKIEKKLLAYFRKKNDSLPLESANKLYNYRGNVKEYRLDIMDLK